MCRAKQPRLHSIFLVLILGWCSVEGLAQASATAEYRTKAALIANFLGFVDWPDDALGAANSPFLVCATGDFPFGTALAESTRGETVHGRRVDVLWIRQESELRTCQVLFVSRSEAKRYRRILGDLRGASVLTIGETPDFLEAGGAVTLLLEQESLQFEVNLPAAANARLKISARVLNLARRVIGRMESSPKTSS